jgi:AhpD family alkylhydroperoxidase
MTPRLNPYKAAPEAMKALVALENYVQESGLDHSLIDLVKTRASQINGCAYCIHMHTSEARARGETEERLYLLDAWQNRPSTTSVSALPWPGPRQSRWSQRPMFPTPSSTKRASNFPKRNWST